MRVRLAHRDLSAARERRFGREESSGKLSWLSLARHLMKANMNAFHYPIEDEAEAALAAS